MKDKIYYLLFKLGQNNSVIKKLYWLYYVLAIKYVTFWLKRKKYIKHAYLKGSFGKEYFVPVMSDLDFFIAGERNKDTEKKLEKTFKRMHILFPIVSDYDFHNEQEMEYLKNHSGLKYLSTEKWKTIVGDEFGFYYRHHPRKFYLDIVQEIYFQMEWLFKNLKTRKQGDKFKSICIQRQFDKIIDLINYMHDHRTYVIKKRSLKEHKRWINFTNEEIIFYFNDYIERSTKLKKVREIYQEEFKDWDLTKILTSEFYKENLEILDGGFEYTGKDHYLTQNNFELFYMTGCLDSYVMWEWCQKTNDKVGKHFIEALYYARLIENRTNPQHGYAFYRENVDRAQNISKLICNSFGAFDTPPPDYFDINVVVTCNWKNDSETEIRNNFSSKKMISVLKKAKTRFLHVDLLDQDRNYYYEELLVDKNTNPFFFVLPVGAPSGQEIIWQRENLYEIGIHWCFGSEIIAVSDRDIYTGDHKWMDKIKLTLEDENDFVIGYEKIINADNELEISCNQPRGENPYTDAFCWAAKYETWKNLGGIVNSSWGLDTNEMFHYQLTGNFPETESFSRVFNDVFSKIFKTTYKVSNVRSTFVLDKKRKSKEVLLRENWISLVRNALNDSIFMNDLGFYNCDFENATWHDLVYSVENAQFLDPYAIISKLNELNEKNLLVTGDLFYLHGDDDQKDHLIGKDGGFGVVVEQSRDRIQVLTGQFEGTKEFEINYSFDLKDQFSANLSRAKIQIDAEIDPTDEEFSVELFPDGFETHGSRIGVNKDNFYNLEIPVYLDEVKSKLFLKAKAHLYGGRTYGFRLCEINTIKLDHDFEYFKKVDGNELDKGLGTLYRAYYKIVVNFETEQLGEIGLISKTSTDSYPKSLVDYSKNGVHYHYVEQETEDLILAFSETIDTSDIIDIDIMKVNAEFQRDQRLEDILSSAVYESPEKTLMFLNKLHEKKQLDLSGEISLVELGKFNHRFSANHGGYGSVDSQNPTSLTICTGKFDSLKPFNFYKELKLDKTYSSGFYLVKLKVKSNTLQGEEYFEISLLPDGLDKQGARLDGFLDSQSKLLSYPVFLDEHKTWLELNGRIHLPSGKYLKIELDEISAVEDSVQFEYFTNLEETSKLENIYKGFHKFVFYFEEEYSGPIQLMNKEDILLEAKVSGENPYVYHSFIKENASDLNFNTGSNDKGPIKRIDILKATLNE